MVEAKQQAGLGAQPPPDAEVYVLHYFSGSFY